MRFPIKPFAQHFDDRNAAGDARFVIKIRPEILGRGEQLLAMGRKQGLVRHDDRLALLQRAQRNFASRGRAADQLDNDVDARIIHDALPIGREQLRWNFDGPRLF